MVALTIAPFVAAVALAPKAGATSGPALGWLLFVGSSMHVAASGWFYAVPEVRQHMRSHRARYVWSPIALIVGLAVLASGLTDHQLRAVLLGFFAWQFFHFQKQNLGIAALAAKASDLPPLSGLERRALVLAGVGGTLALIGHPTLLQLVGLPRLDWAFGLGAVTMVAGIVVGMAALCRRRHRPAAFVVLYLAGLLFFVPVVVFTSPYAAVAGLTVAHGLQYLLLVTLLASASDQGQERSTSLAVLLGIALVLGIALNRAAHLHSGDDAARAVYGAYLGLVCAHFVIDAGLWRLRDEFPREFLTRRLPYLLARP